MRQILHMRFAFGLLLLWACCMQACATSHPARKCNGQKAIRTHMGPM
jgi:hypothetical protein